MLNQLRERLKRTAIELELGRFKASSDPLASRFGRVNACLPGEIWPTWNGEPMQALCQINLTHLPFRPPRLDDLALITVFIGEPTDLDDTPNGEGWCLRAYRSLDGLIPLPTVETSSVIKALSMRARVIDQDFPCFEDLKVELPPEISDEYTDLFENAQGFKLGGWPTLIQSEIYWAPWNKHPAVPEYVFQIDSTEKGNWAWGDSGVGYFGRGTAPGQEDVWTLCWQCY